MSLFTNLLNLHSGNRPVEDSFTEIFAYFLQTNKHLLLTWLQKYSIINDDNYSIINIATQKEHQALESHTENSRLDIVIELSNELITDVIFIESKIGSKLSPNQLEKYAEILSNLKNLRQGILIYITRDYDPQEQIKVFGLKLQPKVKFCQLRWYQFYSFLKINNTDTLAQEILKFMEVNEMSHTNQLSSIDVLTMINFKKTLNFMEATLTEEIKTKIKKDFAGYIRGEGDSLSQWKSQDRYILVTHLSPRKWDVWFGVGYFGLNPDTLTEYPYLGIFLEVSPTFLKRNEVIYFMQKIISNRPDSWVADNLSILPVWSGIYYRKSLREFLSEEDHLSCLKTFFLHSIDVLESVQREFNFPWEILKLESEKESPSMPISSPI